MEVCGLVPGWMDTALSNFGENHYEGVDLEGDYAMTGKVA